MVAVTKFFEYSAHQHSIHGISICKINWPLRTHGIFPTSSAISVLRKGRWCKGKFTILNKASAKKVLISPPQRILQPRHNISTYRINMVHTLFNLLSVVSWGWNHAWYWLNNHSFVVYYVVFNYRTAFDIEIIASNLRRQVKQIHVL